MYAGHNSDVEAQITFLRTEEGGRDKSVRTGYRPQFFYQGEDYDAIHQYFDKEEVFPGETVIAHLHFLYPELLYDRLGPGEQFEIREGYRTVAKGTITRILDLGKNVGNGPQKAV